MNLRFNDPDWAPEFFGGSNRFINTKHRNATRNDYTELTQQLFALILVDFHRNPER
jgi:hypothetical protein